MSIIRIEYTTTPATPPADKLKIYADTADNRLKTINESGIIRILDADEAYQFVTFANDAAYEAVYTAEAGSVYYNTTSSVIRIYDGATWSDISGGGSEFSDANFKVFNDADNTKELTLDISGVTTSTTRTLSVADRDGEIATKADNVSIGFNTGLSNPSHSEGISFYDNTKKAFSYYNEESDVTVNVGQEVLIPVWNESGSPIANGKVVYPSGVNAASGLTTIELADASEKEKCRLIAMATHDIENNSRGYVTRLGRVGSLNTTGLSGVVYLSATSPGDFTTTRPDDGAYVTTVGAIAKVDAVNGEIVVDPAINDLTVEVTDINGFPTEQRTGTTLSFVNGTRTFTIAPTGAGFHYNQTGEKYEKTSSESVIITDVEGGHVIYFNGDTLTALANPNDGQIDSIIRTNCIVSYLYWNATASEYVFLNDERHGISMSPDTHIYLHFTRGSQYLSGLALNSILADDSGADDVDAQFGVDSGFFTDEDLLTVSNAIGSTTGLSIYYLDGAGASLRKTTETGFSVLTDTTSGVGVTGQLVYNQFTGGAWQLTTVANNHFVLCHVFGINGISTEDQIIAVIGQADYATVGAARTGAETEISDILLQIPVPEIVPIATVIFQTSSTYTNTVKARIRTTSDGGDYVDWRTSELSPGAAPSSHNNLADLQLSNTGVTYGHVDDQAQSIYGLKSFQNALKIEAGVLTLKETTTPASETDYGKIYTKTDNKLYFQDGAGTEHDLLAGGGTSYWSRVGTTLSPATAGDDVNTTGDILVRNTGAGYTSIDKDSGGLFLTSGNMDTTNQYTKGLKFGTTDSDFTTNNPKFLAGIFGRATEAYAGDTDSGMALDFFATLTNQGATTTPVRRMSVDSDAIVINPDFLDQDWRMFKSGSGTSWAYNAGTDTHSIDGTINISGTSNITNLNVSVNLNTTGHSDFNQNYLDKNFYIRKLSSGFAFVFDAGNDLITMGSDTSFETGILRIKETTTPTATTNYGKVYTKTDNKLYFQDGAGTEHELAFV